MIRIIRDLADSLYPEWEVSPLPAVKRRGHAGQPGSGPKGTTCQSCDHYRRTKSGSGKVFRKCGLNEKNWTHGAGSDIRAGDPACQRWIAT